MADINLISLTQGKYTIVDSEDFEYLSQWKWFYDAGYAVRSSKKGELKKRRKIYMSRAILNAPENMFADHISGDKLDNRRKNLRIVTKGQNNINSKVRINNTSGHTGVYWNNWKSKWEAHIGLKGKRVYLGSFDNKLEASRIYEKTSELYFGEFKRRYING